MKELKCFVSNTALVFCMTIIFVFLGSNSVKAEDTSSIYKNAVPIMTSNTSPSGGASCSNSYSSNQDAYKAFDGKNTYSGGHAWGTNNTKGTLSYEFPQNKVISAYALDYNEATSSVTSLKERPKEWNFEGWDGIKWVVLDSRIVTDWKQVDKRIFEINNNTPYIKYQLDIISNNGNVNGQVNLSVDELELLEKSNNEAITLDKSTMDLTEGDSAELTATTTPAAVGVTWSSSDSSVATVDSTGKVTAIGAGTATITATTTDGSNLSASCTVNVTANNGGNNGGTTTGASAIVNIAYAKGDNTNNAGGDVSIIFNGVPDTTLSVVKTASVKSVWVGDTFTYTIVVTNTGSKTAKAVVINDSAPNHIQFMPSGITTTQGAVDSSSSASNIVVNVGDIPPSGTVTITVPATVIL